MARPLSAMPSSKEGRSPFSPLKRPAEFSFPEGFGEPVVVRPSTVGSSRSSGLLVRPSSPQLADKREDAFKSSRPDSPLHSPSDPGKLSRPGTAVPKFTTWANSRKGSTGSQEPSPQLVVSRPGTAGLLRKEQSSPEVSLRGEPSGISPQGKPNARLSPQGARRSVESWVDGCKKKGSASWNPENRSSVLELQARVEQARMDASASHAPDDSSPDGGGYPHNPSVSFEHSSNTNCTAAPSDAPPLQEQASYCYGAGASLRRLSVASHSSPFAAGDATNNPGSPFASALSPKAASPWSNAPPALSAVASSPGFLEVWPATSINNRRVTYTVEAVAAGQLTRHERGSRPPLFISLENTLNEALAGIVHAADKEWGHLTPPQRKLRADAESVAAHRQLLMGLAESFATYRPLLLRVACAYDDVIAREAEARGEVLRLQEELEELLEEHKRELVAATLEAQASIHDLEAALALERNTCSRYKARAQAAEEENRECRERAGEHAKIVAEHVRQNGVVLRACARQEQALAELKNTTDVEIDRLTEIVKSSIPVSEYNALKHEHRRVVLEANAKMAEMQSQLDVTTRRHAELMKEKNAMVRERPLLTPRPGATAAGNGKFSAADIPSKPTAEWVAELLASHAALEHKVSLLQARLRGRRALPRLGDLLKQWVALPRVDWFRGLGPSPEVPAFLRCNHRVFNRNMDLDACLLLVRQARARLRAAAMHMIAKAAEKAKTSGGVGCGGEDPSHATFAKLDVGEVVAAVIHEECEEDEQGYIQLGYSLVDAVRRFRYDPEVAVFYRVLRGHLPAFYYAEEAAWVADVKAACRKVESKFGDKAAPPESAGASSPTGGGKKDKGKGDGGHRAGGNISKKEFWKILKAQFPGRSDKHWQQLAKVLDAEFVGSTVNLATLYTGFSMAPPPPGHGQGSKKVSSSEPQEHTLGTGAGAGGGFQSRTGMCLLLQYAEERVEYQQDLAAVLWAAAGGNGGMATESKIRAALLSLEGVFHKGKEGAGGGSIGGGNATKAVNAYMKRGLGQGKGGSARLDAKAPISVPLFLHRLQAGRLLRSTKRADCAAFGVHPDGAEGGPLGHKAQATLLEVRQKVAVLYEHDWWNRLFCDVSDAQLTQAQPPLGAPGNEDDALGPLSRAPHTLIEDEEDERRREWPLSGEVGATGQANGGPDDEPAGVPGEDRDHESTNGSVRGGVTVPALSLGVKEANGAGDEGGAHAGGKGGMDDKVSQQQQQQRMAAFLVARRTKNPVSEEIREAEAALCRESDQADETGSNGDADVEEDGLGVASGPLEGDNPIPRVQVASQGLQSPTNPATKASGAEVDGAEELKSPDKDPSGKKEEAEEPEPELDSFALALQEWKESQAKLGLDAAESGMKLLPAQKSLRAAHTYLEEDLDLDSYLRQIDDSANKIR